MGGEEDDGGGDSDRHSSISSGVEVEWTTAKLVAVLDLLRELSNGGDEHGGDGSHGGPWGRGMGRGTGKQVGEKGQRGLVRVLLAGEGRGGGPARGRRAAREQRGHGAVRVRREQSSRSLQDEEDGEARGRRDGGELVRDDGDRRRKERARFRRLHVSRHA